MVLDAPVCIDHPKPERRDIVAVLDVPPEVGHWVAVHGLAHDEADARVEICLWMGLPRGGSENHSRIDDAPSELKGKPYVCEARHQVAAGAELHRMEYRGSRSSDPRPFRAIPGAAVVTISWVRQSLLRTLKERITRVSHQHYV
jgi:hypothetical protein